ncbi:hypothetical protein [Haladaptatus caseinilyticus]|uniref:hypothetical protein n=1 Tax=Haladaptatus caseinilyticus TaxID=2993314 RepID=UPI00224B05C2|nr:hypothetical protein [Haladaptatus caseinilyticus]
MTKDDRYGATDDDYGENYDDYPDETETTNVNETQTSDDPVSTNRNSGSGGGAEVQTLPFIFARRTVKADREAVPVYVQNETSEEIGELERELSQTFDGDKVMALDVREALIRAGLENLDDVQRVMEEWGYGRR